MAAEAVRGWAGGSPALRPIPASRKASCSAETPSRGPASKPPASSGALFKRLVACNQPAGFASMASTSADAHAVATADRYFSFTLATQPALVTKSPRL